MINHIILHNNINDNNDNDNNNIKNLLGAQAAPGGTRAASPGPENTPKKSNTLFSLGGSRPLDAPKIPSY